MMKLSPLVILSLAAVVVPASAGNKRRLGGGGGEAINPADEVPREEERGPGRHLSTCTFSETLGSKTFTYENGVYSDGTTDHDNVYDWLIDACYELDTCNGVTLGRANSRCDMNFDGCDTKWQAVNVFEVKKNGVGTGQYRTTWGGLHVGGQYKYLFQSEHLAQQMQKLLLDIRDVEAIVDTRVLTKNLASPTTNVASTLAASDPGSLTIDITAEGSLGSEEVFKATCGGTTTIKVESSSGAIYKYFVDGSNTAGDGFTHNVQSMLDACAAALGGRREGFGKANSRCVNQINPVEPCQPNYFAVRLQNNRQVKFGGKNVGGNFGFKFVENGINNCNTDPATNCPDGYAFEAFFQSVVNACDGLLIDRFNAKNEVRLPVNL